jgi:hypothetical protein
LRDKDQQSNTLKKNGQTNLDHKANLKHASGHIERLGYYGSRPLNVLFQNFFVDETWQAKNAAVQQLVCAF